MRKKTDKRISLGIRNLLSSQSCRVTSNSLARCNTKQARYANRITPDNVDAYTERRSGGWAVSSAVCRRLAALRPRGAESFAFQLSFISIVRLCLRQVLRRSLKSIKCSGKVRALPHCEGAKPRVSRMEVQKTTMPTTTRPA